LVLINRILIDKNTVGYIINGSIKNFRIVAFAVIRYGLSQFRNEVDNREADDWSVGPMWEIAIGAAIPVLATVFLGWWLYQSAFVSSPDRWFDPTDPFSVKTCLVQGGVVLSVFLMLNSWMTRPNARCLRIVLGTNRSG
jgi:hypothetical protein